MKNRATLTLMELLLMVLVFALAAAVCLQLFAAAGRLSGEISRQDQAVLLAQNAAEALKAGVQPQSPDPDSGLTLTIQEEASALPGLRKAQIRVLFEEELLFALTTGWQEVDG